ncbi:hypothetical protein Aph01nite_11360 [Acrocarpospora phusangensis]|uniref:Uncharacterized protein n=1 Tax=Acrocarpospora phusangensis TaxID=1070424 RepID=A0A919Q632_9ACTN|nr:hypothetical protein [Acrocarpospora phusangensis]GIH22826.1 hypothetical protein Aph01nite_11360 [Acrocarpospora phusangensis]
MNIEDLLRETLADMADDETPPHPSRFLVTRSVRRPPWLALAAAVAIVVLVAGSTYAVRVLTSQDAPPRPAVVPSPASEPRTVPLAEVWPDAVHTVPLILPNGLSFTPEVFLDADTLLARTGPAQKPRYWAYELDGFRARELFTFTAPPATGYTSGVTIGEGRLVWYTVSVGAIKGALDLWTVPATGGRVTKVTTIRQTMKYGDLDALTIQNGSVIYSRRGPGGIYQVPLTGGDPAPLPSSRPGLHLLEWPWAVIATTGVQWAQTNTQHIVNMLTGEKRDITALQGDPWSCSPTWCLQRHGQNDRFTVAKRDGTSRREVVGASLLIGPPTNDRFVILTKREGDTFRLVLHDITTGDTGDLGITGTPGDGRILNQTMLRGGTQNLYTYPLNGKRIVVNLSAIK